MLKHSIFIRTMNSYSSRHKVTLPLKDVLIYTDGSYMTNPTRGGIGIYFSRGEHSNICENYSKWFNPVINPPTINRCELLAICRAFAICLCFHFRGEIHTDSEYAIRAITGKSSEVNADLIKPLRLIYEKHNGDFILKHVKAHQFNGNPHSIGNAVADALARYGAKN